MRPNFPVVNRIGERKFNPNPTPNLRALKSSQVPADLNIGNIINKKNSNDDHDMATDGDASKEKDGPTNMEQHTNTATVGPSSKKNTNTAIGQSRKKNQSAE
ncbi:hypothetical protein LXL04_007558 [Taraxacum kok-saghyz]